jgi:TetR/AcrR family transcriptional regulator
MPRPRAADPEQTRAAILDAAEEELADHGFRGARMVAIARRAGVTHGLLHYYFDSKEGLYEAVVRRLFEHHLRLFERLRESGSVPTAREVVLKSFDLFLDHPNQVRIMLWEMASGDDRLERAMKSFYDALAEASAGLGADAPSKNGPGGDPRDVYVSILGAAVAYFFRDPTIKKLFGEDRFTEQDRRRRREHLGALLDLLV